MNRPVWAEICRSKLLHNLRLLRSRIGPAELMPVVKGNGYGHGTAACSRVLAADGARWLAVTCIEEAVAVRGVCPEIDILALSGIWPGEADAALAHHLTPVVWEPTQLIEAARPGKQMAIHLEIDTGMSRQGVQLAALPALLDQLQTTPWLRLDGVLTHFHSPEVLDSPATGEQLARFATAVDIISARGLRPRWLHAGNSTSLLFPDQPRWLDWPRNMAPRPCCAPASPYMDTLRDSPAAMARILQASFSPCWLGSRAFPRCAPSNREKWPDTARLFARLAAPGSLCCQWAMPTG